MTGAPDLPPVARPTSTRSPASSGARPAASPRSRTAAPCGEPDVVRTEPRLPDGTPFPTSYYATCPRLTGGAVDAREPGRHARDDRAARGRRGTCAAGTPRRTGTTSSAASQLGEVPEIAGRLGGRDAGARQVPARARRALAGGRARGQPARRRGAGDARPVVGAAPVLGRRARGPRTRAVAGGSGSAAPGETAWAPSTAAPTRSASSSPTSTRRRRARRRRAPDGDRPPRAGHRPHRRHRPRGDGAHARGDEGVRRAVPGARRRPGALRATSASRDARNAADFVAGVHEAFRRPRRRPRGRRRVTRRHGSPSPVRPASCRARHPRALPRGRHRRRLDRARPRAPTDVEAARSVDVGCVRMTERHLRSDPPTAEQVDAARRRHRRGARRGRGDGRPHRHRRGRRPRRHHHHDHRARAAPADLRPGRSTSRACRSTSTRGRACRCWA